MCGIAGIVSLEGVNPVDLSNMSTVLRHRGPDDEGFMLADFSEYQYYKGKDTISAFSGLPSILSIACRKERTIGLVHRRLAVIDLTPAGHQPMSYAEGAYQLVFNGEIYNYQELRQQLRKAGYSFYSESDTEVVLAAYHYWGTDCVNHFRGMWAFALLDTGKKELFLSRDRFGIKPLYYFIEETNFAFASEIKALLALPFIKPEAKLSSALEYVCFGAIADPSANLFSNVKSLAPASNLLINTQTLEIRIDCYYDLVEKTKNYQLPQESKLQESFEALLHQSLSMHIRSDVPIGSALSGGLDSSTLVSLTAKEVGGQVFKTFTAAYQEKEIDESAYAKKVIQSQTNCLGYFAFPDSKTYWNDLDKLIWHQDLPITSTSMFAQWEVMKLAKEQQIKVLLDGQGADEILGGYYTFAGLYLIEKLKKGEIISFIRERNELKKKFSPAINMALARAFYYYLPEALQRKVRKENRLGMGFVSEKYQTAIQSIVVPARGGKTYREQSLLSTQFGLQDLLRYEDRNSMAFSIESRVPFLDHTLVEFSIALPNKWKINNGWTKYILRKTAAPVLPEEVVWRKDKMGFLTPQKIWKEQLKNELNGYLNEVKMPDFLDRNYLLKVNETALNNSSHLSEFWKMISFLKWNELMHVSWTE